MGDDMRDGFKLPSEPQDWISPCEADNRYVICIKSDGHRFMIAAILHVNGGELDPALLPRMLCAGLPFTPATKGTWVKGAIGLADARLWLTDESSSVRLPTQDNRRELVLAWDGRIDNRGDLLFSLD